MALTLKDRALIAQIAGQYVATFNRAGRNVSSDSIVNDAVAIAVKILETADTVLASRTKEPS